MYGRATVRLSPVCTLTPPLPATARGRRACEGQGSKPPRDVSTQASWPRGPSECQALRDLEPTLATQSAPAGVRCLPGAATESSAAVYMPSPSRVSSVYRGTLASRGPFTAQPLAPLGSRRALSTADASTWLPAAWAWRVAGHGGAEAAAQPLAGSPSASLTGRSARGPSS